MDFSEITLKRTSKISFVALVVLLIGSIVFYKERVLFADIAFSAFAIINDGHFLIINNRYGEVIHQLFPYLGAKFHLPLKTILIGYSASFNLIYAIVSAILVYGLKQYRLAVLMAIFYFLMVSVSGLCPSDVSYAVAIMFLFFGVTLHLGHKKIHLVLFLSTFLLLAFITISTHFVVIIPLAFIWSYLIIEKTNWPFQPRMTVLLSALLAAIIAYKYLSTIHGPQSYDNEHLEGMKKLTFQDMFDSFSTPVIKIFLIRCWQNYWVAPLVLITGIVSLIIHKRIFLAVWTLLASVGYFVIMGVSYSTMPFNFLPDEIGKAYQLWHIEIEWSCIGIIVSVPFVFSFLPKIKPTIAVGILASIFLVRLFYMGSYMQDFVWRIRFEEGIMAQMKKKEINNLALHREPERYNQFILDWGMPFETILMSAINGDKPQRTFFFINPDDTQTRDLLKKYPGFYNAYGVLPNYMLNHTYFSVDTTTQYQVMSYETLMK